MERLSFIFFIAFSGLIGLSSCQKELSCESCKDYNQPPIALAGPDLAITLPIDSIMLDGSKSTDPAGKISAWRWTKITGPASFSIINVDSVKTRVRNLKSGIYQFELKVTDDRGLSAKDTVQVVVYDPAQPNHPPVACAGVDQTITLPVNTVTLNGSCSSDPDNNIASYTWSKITGPASFSIINVDSVKTGVRNLKSGIYQFELKVTDDKGLSAKDTVQVVVNDPAQTDHPPVACAGVDQTITLPVNTVTLNGSCSSDPDNNIASYTWSKISGPSSFSISNTSAMLTQVTSLVAGTYLFELTVTDLGGLSDTDTSMVEVKPSNNSLVDIYIAGGYGGPKYWKNGQEVLLYPDLPGADFASSIAVVGNDIYVAGDDIDRPWPAYSWPRYWKNGYEVRLTNGTTYAGTTSIAVANNDVYVAGWEYVGSNSLGVYWKNGQKVVLTNSMHDGSASCIAIVGHDVYVSGDESNGSGLHVAKYWKNGQEVVLSGMYNGSTTSIAVVGSDVYVSGEVYKGSNYVATYWKNGQEFSLPNVMNDVATTSIAIAGNDVYVTGYEGDFHNSHYVAKYWKNGQEFSLPNGRIATSIAIYGSDVYIAGNTNGSIEATYWKNGQEVILPNGFDATSIVVVKH